ncbi:hypothetical protein OHA25_09915 [Nonomuraea sp. NBC_00507]|uniref:hypothetical protein n=1 Tax=Nonomuraea sp. NBC_00507 TaxID=2976002 RepID=UPI002E180C5A
MVINVRAALQYTARAASSANAPAYGAAFVDDVLLVHPHLNRCLDIVSETVTPHACRQDGGDVGTGLLAS